MIFMTPLSISLNILQNNDENQHSVNNFRNQQRQEVNIPSPSSVNGAAAFVPPDVTHQANDIKPDLIQDVTKEQPDLTKRENGLPQSMGEPEKVRSDIILSKVNLIKITILIACM